MTTRDHTAMTEYLTKAEHDAGFLVGTLQDTLSHSGAVDAIIIYHLIEQSVLLQQRIAEYAAARQAPQ